MLTPKPFQESDIQAFLDEPTYGSGNFSTVGVGKTLVGTEITRRLEAKRSLIIAPPNTLDGWVRHYRLQMDAEIRRCSGKNEAEQAALLDFQDGKPGHYFMGWEFGRGLDFGKAGAVDMLIADEVHRVQNRKTASAALFHSLAAATLKQEGRVLGMSGTPAGNELTGIWSVAKGLWPERYTSYWKWADAYFRRDWNSYAGIPEHHVELEQGAVMQSLPHYVRHEQGFECCEFHPRGVQEDLPKRVTHTVGVDLTPTQRKLYDEMDADMVAWIEDNDWPITAKGLPVIEYMRLLQIALAVPTAEMKKVWKTHSVTGQRIEIDQLQVSYPLDTKSSKIDATLDILADIPAGERVVIFTHSAAIIPALVHRINQQGSKAGGTGHRAEAWDGSVSAFQRSKIKSQFMSPDHSDLNIIVAQVAALAEGVDGLQYVCANEIWFSPSANNMENVQALGRLERTGQTRPVNSWRIVARDTREEDKNERLAVRETRLLTALRG